VLDGVSFNLRRGEILGIAGLMGSGRTELVTTIFGEYGKITGGSIKLEGQELHIHGARDAMHKGISLVPEDRKGQGLVLMQSILKNISLANLDRSPALCASTPTPSWPRPPNRPRPGRQGAQPAGARRFAFGRQPAEGGHRQVAALQPPNSDHG
jgi:energy-coupling factor transporter ATP-binding protein EcfA2